MLKFGVSAICIALAWVSGGSAMSPDEYGMQMSSNAYEAVCWWENLKQFPKTNTKGHTQCTTQAKQQMDNIMKDSDGFFKKYPDKRPKMFGKWVNDMAMSGLPNVYQEKCGDTLKDPKMTPASDESDALNDGGNDYPFKAFAYCMLHTLREEHGDEAIEQVKSERTHSKKHWMQTLLDRENEFRVRHGVEPLKLVKDLNTAAQAWADENAKSCNMHHSKNDDDFRQFRGSGTGESLSAGMGDYKEDAAYQAADGWYEEIQDYPYPDGFTGNLNDPLFEKIGHFTQSVWKGSKYVGYGYSYNPDCPSLNRFIAARYFPAGNMIGNFTKNVMSPKSS